jgi:molybdopterin converting factor small subunit
VTKLNVLLFAILRELVEADSISIEVTLPATASDILSAIAQDQPALVPWLASCRLAVDQVFVADDHLIETAVELALIPPVSGG